METLEITTPLNDTLVREKITVNLKEIETRGFVVIRNFLSKEEVATLVNDYNESKARAHNSNYPITDMSPAMFSLLSPKIMKYSQAVAKATSTEVDMDQGGIYFSVKAGVDLPWHQDHESFFINQNHVNYLNFYMIIIKDKPEEANLNVVRFDKFKEKSPEYYNRVVGRGAISYTVKDGQTRIFCDEPEEEIGILPYDIGTLSETPQLNAGDLLLLRGDSIHSTQSSKLARVALSVRMVNSQNKINLKRMAKGNKLKRIMQTNNRFIFDKIFNAFKQLNVTEATYSELLQKFMLDSSPVPSKFKFTLRLLKLRLRFMFAKV